MNTIQEKLKEVSKLYYSTIETSVDKNAIEVEKICDRKQIHSMYNKCDLRNISFQDIDEKFSYGQYGDFDVIIMRKNGYINATKLCAIVKKKFKNWLQNKNSTDLINEASNFLGIDKEFLIIKKMNVKNFTRGSYVHPKLIPHIAMWMSPKFAIKVSVWLEQWKNYSKENNLSYWRALSSLEPYKNDNKEYLIKLELARELGGEIEVDTEVGDIDVVTHDSIIEIKKFKQWKHALGQILAYAETIPHKKKVIYLFDYEDNENELDMVKHILKKYNIIVKTSISYDYMYKRSLYNGTTK